MVVSSIPKSGFVRTNLARLDCGRPPTQIQATSDLPLNRSWTIEDSSALRKFVTSIVQASEAASARDSMSSILNEEDDDARRTTPGEWNRCSIFDV
mmetsp:Transcript_30299/g.34541  ORF Transcript_30299/g.34541 Transcript_30299/m.34541 type:complete len:96 (+) Transcript_30299:521-808(+)